MSDAHQLTRLLLIEQRATCVCQGCDQIEYASELNLVDGRLLCAECEGRVDADEIAMRAADRRDELHMERIREMAGATS